MKAVILAGGLGTRISEETQIKPKPMIEIGGKPILWHIMKSYSAHGVNDFVICCGYRGYVIKEYFANYFLHMSDVTFDMGSNTMQVHQRNAEPWRVTLVDTGESTMTGGRLKRVADYIRDELTQDEFLGELIREKLIYYPTVTREAFKHTGRLTTAIESGQLFKDIGLPPLDPAVDRAMICGSPSMLKETSEMLDAKGFKVSPSLGQMGDYVFERAFVEK
jgi:hypothetical protein